jgi:hypothetical protein
MTAHLDLDDIEDDDGVNSEDVELCGAIYLSGVAIACCLYKITIELHLAVAEDRVFGRMDMGEPYKGRRYVKAKAYHARLTRYAVASVCGREALRQTLGHVTGAEGDVDDAGAYLNARERRHIPKSERDKIIAHELRQGPPH